jgi:hypothetical protein
VENKSVLRSFRPGKADVVRREAAGRPRCRGR